MNRLLNVLTGAVLLVAGCGPPAQPVQEVSVSPEQVSIAEPITVADDDWPWWRGPQRNNVARCDTAPLSWSDTENVVWKARIPGRGHGSPTVLGNQVFLCTADESAQKQIVLCIDRSTGAELWQTTVHTGGFPGRGAMHPKSTHANGTVATDGSSTFVGFLNSDHVFATSLSLQGKILWQRDLGYFGAKFGYAASPCLFESVAIYAADNQGGAFLSAVHRETGEIVWRKARSNVSTYSSAIAAEIGGKPLLLLSGDNKVAAYEPLTGREVWSCPGTAEATCGTVVWQDNLVFASGGYPERQTICVDADTGQKVWEDNVKCYEQSMLVAGGHLFAVTDDGIAICRDARTGEMSWRQRLAGPISASPLLVGNTIYATSEAGTTWAFKATPQEYQQLARNQLGTESFASLVACGDQIFARVASGSGPDRQEVLYCLGAASE